MSNHEKRMRDLERHSIDSEKRTSDLIKRIICLEAEFRANHIPPKRENDTLMIARMTARYEELTDQYVDVEKLISQLMTQYVELTAKLDKLPGATGKRTDDNDDIGKYPECSSTDITSPDLPTNGKWSKATLESSILFQSQVG